MQLGEALAMASLAFPRTAALMATASWRCCASWRDLRSRTGRTGVRESAKGRKQDHRHRRACEL